MIYNHIPFKRSTLQPLEGYDSFVGVNLTTSYVHVETLCRKVSDIFIKRSCFSRGCRNGCEATEYESRLRQSCGSPWPSSQQEPEEDVKLTS